MCWVKLMKWSAFYALSCHMYNFEIMTHMECDWPNRDHSNMMKTRFTETILFAVAHWAQYRSQSLWERIIIRLDFNFWWQIDERETRSYWQWRRRINSTWTSRIRTFNSHISQAIIASNKHCKASIKPIYIRKKCTAPAHNNGILLLFLLFQNDYDEFQNCIANTNS